MPTIGSVTKTIRISPEDLGVIEGLMEDGATWSGAVHKLCRSYMPIEKKDIEKKDNPVLAEIEEMSALCGCTLENVLNRVCEMLNDGTLMINNGEMSVGLPEWVERFEDICHDKGVPVEKMIEIVRKM